MTIPKLTPYTGQVANPDGSQNQTEFTQNMFGQLSYEAQLATELDATIDGMNQAVTDVENSAAAASESATAAEAAASTAGYQGLWPDTGGSALKGETYQTQVGGTPTGDYYTALQNTTVEPVSDNVNWKRNIGEKSITESQNDIVGGLIFKGSNGKTVENGDTVPVGATHLRVLVDSKPTAVAMLPVSSGAVSLLTETSATVGSVDVTFNKIGTKEFKYLYDLNGNLVIDGAVFVGDKVVVDNYHENGNSGILFFRAVPAGTGVHDGGKYIDLPESGLQLEQNLRIPINVSAYGAKGDGVIDDTAAIQGAMNTLEKVYTPYQYGVTSLVIKEGMKGIFGDSSGYSKLNQLPTAVDDMFKWDGSNRVTRFNLYHLQCAGNGASGRHGLNLSGISYSTFVDLTFYNFPVDGIFMDGQVVSGPSQQVSNNSFNSVRSLDNGRDGIFFYDSQSSGDANSANTFICCEFARNGRHGVNHKDGTSNHFIGCTSQGNSVQNLYTNGRYLDWTGYIEPDPFSVVFDANSYGCNVKTRSSYPLWSSYINAGSRNMFSVYGEDMQSRHVFRNHSFNNWVGVAPDGISLIGTPQIAGTNQGSSEGGVNMRVTFDDVEGILIDLDLPASELSGEWVTVAIDWNLFVSDDKRLTIRTQVDGVDNTDTGESVLTNYETFAGYNKSFYDVRFKENSGTNAKIKILFATDAPPSTPQIVDIRSICIYTGQTTVIPPFKDYKPGISANTAQLQDSALGINTVLKSSRSMVFNNTDGRVYYPISDAPTGQWRSTDGSSTITPT